MDRSPGFGSTPSNLIAHLRLAFATAPHLKCLTLLLNVTRWPVLQKVRGHTSNVLPQLVSAGFQVLFHSPPGVLFTFPSRYWFTIGHRVVFSLARWSWLFPTGFLVSRRTQVLSRTSSLFRLRGCHPVSPDFPFRSPIMSSCPFLTALLPRLLPVWALPLSLAAT